MHFADDLGALAGGAVGLQAHLVHAVQNAAMHRLQAVANVGQRAAHDHAHGVIEIRPPHLVFDIDGDLIAVAAAPAAQRHLGILRRRRWTLRRIFLIGQAVSFGWVVSTILPSGYADLGERNRFLMVAAL